MSKYQQTNKENVGNRNSIGTRRRNRRSVLKDLNIASQETLKRKRNSKLVHKEKKSSQKKSSRTKKKTKKKHNTAALVQNQQTLPLASKTSITSREKEGVKEFIEPLCQDISDSQLLFGVKFRTDIDRILNYKMKTKKFQYTKRILEQSKLIRETKNIITDYQRRTKQFTDSCILIEEQLLSEKKQCERNLISAKEAEEIACKELKESKIQLNEFQKKRSSLQVDKEKIQLAHEQLEQQLKEARNKNQELESKIIKMTATLEASDRKLTFGNTKFEKSKEQLANKTSQCEKIQIEHEKELILQQTEFNGKLKIEQEKLFGSKSEVELLLQEKKIVEGKLKKEQIQAAVLKSKHSRFCEKIQALQEEKERQHECVKDLKQKIEIKSKELASFLSSFNRNQSFNEERINTLSAEKKKMEEKLNILEIEKESTDKINRDLKKTLCDVKDSSKQRTEQYNNTCVQLEEAKQKLELIKTNFSESFEKSKNQHQQNRIRLEEEEGRLRHLIMDKDNSFRNMTERTEKLSEELAIFKEKCNATNKQQLEEFCRLAMEAHYLRKQLSGNENVAKKLTDLQTENKELTKKMADSEMMCKTLHKRLQKLKSKRKS